MNTGSDISLTPKLSVVMPVHNGLPFLPLAIESILGQSFQDFEFIIGDDCSTDGSYECIQSYALSDPRIRFLHSPLRLGPVQSANWVAYEAAGDFVARMDADDISSQDRLSMQLCALIQYPEAVLAGSIDELINTKDKVIRGPDYSILCSPHRVPCAHSSIMYRAAIFKLIGGYQKGSDYFEDQDLYRRLHAHGPFLIFSSPLVSVRASWAHHRLRDDRSHVIEQLSIRYKSPSACPKGVIGDEYISHRVVRAFMVLGLWSGVRSWDFNMLIRKIDLKRRRESMALIILGLACCLMPSVVRNAVRLRAHWRSWRLRKLIQASQLYLWNSGVPPINVPITILQLSKVNSVIQPHFK